MKEARKQEDGPDGRNELDLTGYRNNSSEYIASNNKTSQRTWPGKDMQVVVVV
jgi:hypothetical protein